DVDLHVGLGDVDLDLFRLGQNRDGGGGGVDAALGLGGGDALDAVHAAFVPQPLPDAHAAHAGHRVAQAALLARRELEHLELPALGIRVALVHLEQVAGP